MQRTSKDADKIEKVPLTDLIFYERNAKEHPQDQVDEIAMSITQYGFKIPILIDTKNIIIAGHGRYLAAKKLGLEKVPCIRADDLSPEQIKAFRLADNKAAESGWNEEALTQELVELFESGYDLELTGFDDKELKKLLKDFDVQSEKDKTAKQPKKKLKPKALKLSDQYGFQIIVECLGENQQSELIARFKKEGLKCRPLIL